jgi:hypothetical protein
MWFWGDTARMSYPLGHFWMAAAASELPGQGGLDPANGVNLNYLTDESGFSRPVARLGVEKGVIWADGFVTLPDSAGQERLLCHYAHMESLGKMLGHGLAVFNDERAEFERLKTLRMEERDLFPGQAHPLRYRSQGVEFIYLGQVFPNVRVRADWEHYQDPEAYEVYTCSTEDELTAGSELSRDADGRIRYQWRRGTKPIDGSTELRLVSQGRLSADQAHFLPRDVETGEPVIMHRGSVRWNAYRKCWIMIATQVNGSSHLGEVWYAEAAEPTGPWRKAIKIVTHQRYSFYNPVHHAMFDQEGGRIIYFEGTYTHTFSGNPVATPRYDYNQIMYRLDLASRQLTEKMPSL